MAKKGKKKKKMSASGWVTAVTIATLYKSCKKQGKRKGI